MKFAGATDRAVLLDAAMFADPNGYVPPIPIDMGDGLIACDRCGAFTRDVPQLWALHVEWHRQLIGTLVDMAQRLPPAPTTIIDG